jgi:Asp-tRNA(Asn)/Glu-tRNA(Gln) amidotransferase A subunit family amidase
LVDDKICWMSALELTEAYAKGKMSPVDALEAILERVKRYNPELNAIVTPTETDARAAARKAERDIKAGKKVSPLSGVPITIKDLVWTKGVRTTFGSKLYENFVPDEDAVLVERLKNAGAVIIGKTNVPEFGLIAYTDNLIFGPTRNPWDKTKTSGGSSGGAAAAVAAGMGPIAHGNDGGGSIRIPASFCGVYGIKPSFGRVPDYPGLTMWETMNSDGPITRTVSDAALMLDVMAGPDERDRFSLPAAGEHYLENVGKGVAGARVAYTPNLGYAAVDVDVENITRKAAFAFEMLECEVTEIKPDLINMENDLITFIVAKTVTTNAKRFEEWKKILYPYYSSFLALEPSLKSRDIVQIDYKREELWKKMRKIFDQYDFLLTPVTAVAAFDIGQSGPVFPSKIAGRGVGPIGWMPFTYPFNFTGQPAASIPCGFTARGLPIGLQIVGRRYDDLGVLKASRAYEKRFPWQGKKPPL